MRILFFNQYYPPDTAATAQRLGDLCEDLAARHQVTVICGCPSYEPTAGHAGDRRGPVRAVRVWSTRFHRSNMAGRIVNYLSYLVLALVRGLGERRPSVVVAMTDPPVIGLIAWMVAVVKRVPFVYVVQDLYPDVAVVLGKLRNRLLVGVLEKVTRFLLRRADALVAISETMRARLVEKGMPTADIRVISNWADMDLLAPEPKDGPFSRQHGLVDRFVVMYSGNVGLSQNLETLVEAAAQLSWPDLRVVIIGEGAGKAKLVEMVRELGLTNVLFLPYQPLEAMRHSFAAADVFVIPLGAGLDGFVVPSKVFAIMASGRPFIAAVDPTSEVAEIANKYACGLVVRPGSVPDLVATIEWAYSSRDGLRRMGVAGRRAVESTYNRREAVARYGEVLEQVATRALGRALG